MQQQNTKEDGRSQITNPDLFDLNRRQLDNYQKLTMSQCQAALILTGIAAFVAVFLLVVGSWLVLYQVGQDEKLLASGLTAFGSLLSASLSGLFFLGHHRAAKRLNHYYLEPLLTGRILTVERMLKEHLPAGRDRPESAQLLMQWVRELEFPPDNRR